MKPEGEGWIRAEVAAKMLRVREDYVKQLVSRGELKRWEGSRKPFYYRIEDVEALARQPERMRRLERRETAQGKRKWLNDLLAGMEANGPGWERRAGLISAREAAKILGVSRIRVGELARQGQLAVYQANEGKMGSPHWFLREDVLARREVLQEKANAVVWCVPKVSKPWRRRYMLRVKLKLRGQLDLYDVSVRERYFAEWLTARQVACMLQVSMFTVYAHRKKGHLHAEKKPEYGYKNQLMFRTAEVKAMMGSDRYYRQRVLWESVHSEQGKARRAEEQRLRSAAYVGTENERLPYGSVNEWLRKPMLPQEVGDW